MFHNHTSKRCNFTGLLAPNLCESLRGMTSVVDWRRSVAMKLKQTGQRLLIAHMHMPQLCAQYRHILLCGHRLSSGPPKGLGSANP